MMGMTTHRMPRLYTPYIPKGATRPTQNTSLVELSLATFMGIVRPDVWEEGYRAVEGKRSEMDEEVDGGSRPLFRALSIDMKTNRDKHNS